MSGGSMDYLYQRVRDASFRTDTPERRAFARHLEKVAEALHDIEWVDSCDYSPGDETAAILACLGEGATLRQCIEDAKRARDELSAEIAKAEAKP